MSLDEAHDAEQPLDTAAMVRQGLEGATVQEFEFPLKREHRDRVENAAAPLA